MELSAQKIAALDSVFRIVTSIGRRRSSATSLNRYRFWSSDTWWFLGFVIIPTSLSILCATVAWWLSSPGWQIAALALLAASYVTATVIYPLVMLFRYRIRVRRFVNFPASVLIDDVRRQSEADAFYVQLLSSKKRRALLHVLGYLRLKRKALEKRTGLLVGALDKVGVIPGLATLAAAFHSLGGFNATTFSPNWITGVVYGIFALYVIGWFVQLSAMWIDRTVLILELAIEASTQVSDEA